MGQTNTPSGRYRHRRTEARVLPMMPLRARISRLVGATVLAWRRRFFLPALRHAKENVGRMQFLLDLRRHGIMDAGVLRAMEEVPREKFVMTDHVRSAYADRALPILCGQTISQPYVVAYMTEQLALGPPPIIMYSRSAPAPAIRRRFCRGLPPR
jgi:hypothetical protein